MDPAASPDPPGEAALAAWLALEAVPGLGPDALGRLLAEFDSPQAILAAPVTRIEAVAGRRLAAAIAHTPRPAEAQALLARTRAWLDTPGNHFIPRTHAAYPAQLLHLADPPAWLYVKGDPDWLARPMLAIVGSRHATPQGLRDAGALARALSEAGLTVVSGLALGVDAAAHDGALAGIGSTVAVVGTGLDRVYPARHRELAHRIAAQGALVTEFPLGTPPRSGHFPRRNRIISGLALGVLVVEAALESGSLITARQALEQGREVFAVPGSIHSALSKGCHRLIKQGAKLVESAQDILEELAPRLTGHSAAPAAVPTTPAPTDALLDALTGGPLALDQLAGRLGLTVDALSVSLLAAELAGHVARLPGGLYQRLY